MNYKAKRIQNKFSKPFIAYKLGLSLYNYDLVERGVMGISADKIEKFSDIMSNSASYRLEEMMLLKEAKEWYARVDLDVEMEKFGYSNTDLASALNVSNTKVWDYRHKHPKRICDAGILEFYLFLTDENNKKYSKSPILKPRIEETSPTLSKAKEWYVKTDIKEYVKDFGYSAVQLANALGWSRSKMNNYTNKHLVGVSDKSIEELYIFLTNEDNRRTLNNREENKEMSIFKNKNVLANRGKSEETDPNYDIEGIRNKLTLLESINDKLAQENDQKEKEIKMLYDARNDMSKQIKILEVRCQAYENYIMNK